MNRLHFLDSMRAILMLLGVVLHSAQVFNPETNWIIHSNNTSALMTYLVNIISMFRMPAFFVVSGYFCYLTLNKYKTKKFLTVRLKRIVIPFLATALIVNSLQAAFLNWIGWHSFEFTEYMLTGGYVSHLWFLTNITVYFVMACVLLTAFDFIASKLNTEWLGSIFNKIQMLVLIMIMPLFSMVILALNKVGFPLYTSFFGVFNTFSILTYFPFFIFGFIVATNKNALSRLCTVNPIICLVVIAVSIQLVSLLSEQDDTISIILSHYLTTLSQWFSILICFFIFYRYLNKQSKIMLILSNSSYTVYLFHHIFVLILGSLLIYIGAPAILGGVMLMLVVGVITLLIHQKIIIRHKVLSYLFNGK